MHAGVGKDAEDFTETVFGLGDFVGFFGSQRAAFWIFLWYALIKLVAKLFFVEVGVSGFRRILGGLGGGEGFRGKGIDGGLEIAKISVGAHERALAGFPQCRGKVRGACVVALAVGGDGANSRSRLAA